MSVLPLIPRAYDLSLAPIFTVVSALILFSAFTTVSIGVAAADELVIVVAPEASVPVVVRFSSPKEIVPLLSVMLPLASVRLPTVDPVAALIVEEKEPVPVTERAPEASVPVVERFSLSNDIDPLLSVMLPLARVRLPTVDPVAALIVDEKVPVPVTDRLAEASVPEVVRFSSPKEIAPLLSVILPLASVRVPTVDPVAAEMVEEKAPVPVTLRAPEASVPVVERFSSPNEIAPLLSVMLPFASVRLPILEFVAAVSVPVNTPAPFT